MYDDRMVKVVSKIAAESGARAVELLVQDESTEAFHSREDPRHPDEIASLWRVDASALRSAPTRVGIIDDLLTTGAHFCAAKQLIASRYPAAQIIGLFVARRVFPPE